MAKNKKNKQHPALLDSDVHTAFMKIKNDESLVSISAAMRQVLKEFELLKEYIRKEEE